jgi:hypothetical protein
MKAAKRFSPFCRHTGALAGFNRNGVYSLSGFCLTQDSPVHPLRCSKSQKPAGDSQQDITPCSGGDLKVPVPQSPARKARASSFFVQPPPMPTIALLPRIAIRK